MEQTLTAKPMPILEMVRRVFRDPFDVDASLSMIHHFARIPGLRHLATLQAATLPSGQRALLKRLTRERPDWDYLGSLPKGTLGREWHDWAATYNLPTSTQAFMESYDDWLDIDPWPYARLFKIHDIQHLITGYTPESVFNEVRLVGFLLGGCRPDPFAFIDLFGMPVAALFAKQGFRPVMRAYKEGLIAGWKKAPFDLLMYPYEQRWECTLEEVQTELGIR